MVSVCEHTQKMEVGQPTFLMTFQNATKNKIRTTICVESCMDHENTLKIAKQNIYSF